MRTFVLPMGLIFIIIGAAFLVLDIRGVDESRIPALFIGGVVVFGGLVLSIMALYASAGDTDTWSIGLPSNDEDMKPVFAQMESILVSKEYRFNDLGSKEISTSERGDGLYTHSFEMIFPEAPKLGMVIKQEIYHVRDVRRYGPIWLEILNITKENIRQAKTLREDLSSLVGR